MKIMAIFFLLAVFLSGGCVSYKFQRQEALPEKGYAALRDGYMIPEYTIGKDNSMPGLKLAKERLKMRKGVVEDYYKKMGYIENRFKEAVWDPPIILLKTIWGVFRLPSIAISDYKYRHNPKYREWLKNKEAEQDAKEEARINKLKEELNIYIKSELAKENP